MCFSPEADFAGGGAVAVLGAYTLRQVRVPREVVVGALPLLLGAHQFVEGFVWLGLRGEVASGVAGAARDAYVVFAHAVLPALVPIGFVLLEPDPRRARRMWPLVAIGVLLGAYLLWQVAAFPVAAREQDHCIDYVTHAPDSVVLTVLYVLVTCGPALAASSRRLQAFGLVNLLGVALVAAVRADELTSLWCLYAALVSVLVLAHFRAERRRARLMALGTVLRGKGTDEGHCNHRAHRPAHQGTVRQRLPGP